MNRILRIAFIGILLVLSACSSLSSFDSSWFNNILYTPTPLPVKIASATPRPVQETQSATGQPEPSDSEAKVLRVWLPPQFDPNANNPASALLKQRLANFEAEHPGLEIEVRLKAETGEADLLNALSVTSIAAPDALPDLVALPRPALEAAAQKGLVRPFDESSPQLQDSYWYPYARDLAKIDSTIYGIPFAGDASVIIYRSDLVWIKTWDDILLSESHLVFSGADPQAQTGLAMYVSAGGEFLDAQGRPSLDQEILTRVLEVFSKGKVAMVFPDADKNLSRDEQVLQEYRTRRADMAIVHFSDYHASQDGLVQPLMGLDESHLTFATSWLWALAGQNPGNQKLATELAEFLTADDFLSKWIEVTGYLPTRQFSTIQSSDSPIPDIIEAARPIPSTDTLEVLGPVMQEALVRVLSGEQPEAVARSVIEKLK